MLTLKNLKEEKLNQFYNDLIEVIYLYRKIAKTDKG